MHRFLSPVVPLSTVLLYALLHVGGADAFATQTKATCSSNLNRGAASFVVEKVKPPIEAEQPVKFAVKNSNFARGTFNISVSGTYVLEEDIILDMPEADTSVVPFQHGFVIGIAITVGSVKLNLNGHTIKMTRAFANRARFFNIIELAQQVFKPDVAGYVEDLEPAKHVIIENGTIGLSSHCAIHGNNNDRIIIRDLIIQDFEVSAIAMNFGSNIIVERVVIDNSKLVAPVHSNFAIAWNLQQRLKEIASKGLSDVSSRARGFLKDGDFKDVVNNPGSDRLGFTINEGGKPEGSIYGIYFSSEFNIDGIGRDTKVNGPIHVRNVVVRGITAGPSSKISFNIGDNSTDSLGYMFQWDFLFDKEGQPLEQSVPINKLKFKIMREWMWAQIQTGDMKNNPFLLSVHPDMERGSLKAAASYGLARRTGPDSRTHTPKGAFGMRFEGLKNVFVNNCDVSGIANTEQQVDPVPAHANTRFPQVWRGGDETKRVYKGTYAYGLSFASCEKVILEKVSVDGVLSETGNSFGVAFIRDLSQVILSEMRISNIAVDDALTGTARNIRPKAMEIFVATNGSNSVKFEGTSYVVHSPPNKRCAATSNDNVCLGKVALPACPPPAAASVPQEPAKLLSSGAVFLAAFVLATCAGFATFFIALQVKSYLKSGRRKKRDERRLADGQGPREDARGSLTEPMRDQHKSSSGDMHASEGFRQRSSKRPVK